LGASLVFNAVSIRLRPQPDRPERNVLFLAFPP
jgi:hypothetical protein